MTHPVLPSTPATPATPATRSEDGSSDGAGTWYSVEAENAPGGPATVSARESTITFDGSAATGELYPGPADLLAAALAACVLKNVERFSRLLQFRYEHAHVHVEIERQEPPPRIARARYTLRIAASEPQHRIELLHRNIQRFGTITNTLAAACELDGTIAAGASAGTEQE